MPTQSANGARKPAIPGIDRTDVRFAVLLGLSVTVLKLAEFRLPVMHFTRTKTDIVASALTISYIIARARRAPQKLDDWGLTSPLTLPALLMGFLLLGVSMALLAAGGCLAGGRPAFQCAHVAQMIEYIPAAFPQQFVLCSVALASLAALPIFRGWWRLPIAAGIAFSLAHFWTPVRIPGTIVPVQILITFPAGVGAPWYFLRSETSSPSRQSTPSSTRSCTTGSSWALIEGPGQRSVLRERRRAWNTTTQ